MSNIMKKFSFLSLSLALSSALCSAKTDYEELVTFYENPFKIDETNYHFSIVGNHFSFDYAFKWADNITEVKEGLDEINAMTEKILGKASSANNFNEFLFNDFKKELKIQGKDQSDTFYKFIKTLPESITNIDTIQFIYGGIKRIADASIIAMEKNPDQKKQIIMDKIVEIASTLDENHNINILERLNKFKMLRNLISGYAEKCDYKTVNREKYTQFKADRIKRIKETTR